MEKILAELTESQKAAVTHAEGPMLVLAGPGSGKTRVITRRIAWLIASGLPPARILAVTFTNKAAGEMQERLRAMGIPPGSTICTFHSLCARLLREFADRAGLPPRFTIYDQSDQKAVLRDIYREKSLDAQRYPPAAVLRGIGWAKSGAARPAARRGYGRAEDIPDDLQRELSDAYATRLREAGALDFDDLLIRAAALLEGDDGVRAALGRRFASIMVDEYQDTNTAQYRIARALAAGHGNLFVTGDPDQSIYGWRGADIENILAFERDFPGAPVVRLEENFRSSPQVLRLADGLIRANVRRKDKRLISRRPGGEPPRLYRYADESEEALGAAAWIREMRESHGLEYRRIAIFYRTNAMSRVLEEALVRARIPYQIVKGLEFLERREVKDMLAYVRMIVNPRDRAALSRIINRPARGIGEATVAKLIAFARESGCEPSDLLDRAESVPGLPPATGVRVREFGRLLETLREWQDRPAAEALAEVFVRSGLKKSLEDEKDTDASDNIEELIQAAREFDREFASEGGLVLFLQQTVLMSDADAYDERSGAVSLMTLHSAKGLEFAAVLIVGVEDGIIPHVRSSEGGRELEEERRLLFVGVTRAERFLALSHVRSRTVHGTTRTAIPSPFLKEAEGLEIAPSPLAGTAQPFHGARPTTAAVMGIDLGGSGDAESAATGYRTGQRVRHPSIGPGRIEQIMPDGERSRALIAFDSGARLTLVLKFARLEPERLPVGQS